jgi:hypothetical protein
VHKEFKWEGLRKKYLEDIGIDGEIILKWIFRRTNSGNL